MIYFIQAGDLGPIKIGRATNPAGRLGDLQVGSHEQLHLRAVLDVDDSIESHFHALLDHCRLRGEWFQADEMIVNISMACAMAGHVWDPHNVLLEVA